MNNIADIVNSPIFQRARQAPPMLTDLGGAGWKNPTRSDITVRSTSLRLDHLIRKSVNFDQYAVAMHAAPLCFDDFNEQVVCAIKAFVRHLKATLPGKQISAGTRAAIQERIEFATAIADLCDRNRQTYNREPLSDMWFETQILNLRESGRNRQYSLDDVVYTNPAGTDHGAFSPHEIRYFLQRTYID